MSEDPIDQTQRAKAHELMGSFVAQFEFDFANEEQLKALGRITLQFSQLEGSIKWFLVELLNPNDHFPGLVVTSKSSFRNMCDMLGSLAKRETEYSPSNVVLTQNFEKLQGVLKKIAQLEEKRNGLVHSDWMRTITEDELLRVKHRSSTAKGYSKVLEHLNADDINAIAQEMVSADYELLGIMAEFTDTLRYEGTAANSRGASNA